MSVQNSDHKIASFTVFNLTKNVVLPDNMAGYPSRSDLSRMKYQSALDLGGTYNPSRRTTLLIVLCASAVCFLLVGCVMGALSWQYMEHREHNNNRTSENSRTIENHAENNRTSVDYMDSEAFWMISTGKENFRRVNSH